MKTQLPFISTPTGSGSIDLPTCSHKEWLDAIERETGPLSTEEQVYAARAAKHGWVAFAVALQIKKSRLPGATSMADRNKQSDDYFAGFKAGRNAGIHELKVKLGSIKSAKKSAAARENGKLGGRPKKQD